ncbi:ABC transporter permease [Bailinhaonella thermotolerans]|uniref:ABC transporter permease n=1 Tax=Bailinhaonella thermotolerans TaxID=1070861 RepID=A0A3A4AAW5_9ACTN|nr:ABC transporter permease subunit [Bailinhaonella thermotolerans]RJL23554.1 ABC transporter permease [Bailinhaonella thermotolerans]
MNATIAAVTYRGMIGSRRIWLLVALPLIMVGLALLLRLTNQADEQLAVILMQRFAVGALLPLMGLIVGTGVIAREIEDGVIIYMLSKPIPRPVVAYTKLLVAVSLMIVFAAIPTFLAGYLMVGAESGVATGFFLGTAAGGIAYAAVFLLISVLTRYAVTIGVIYALIWEGLVGGIVPGARQFSIQQWTQSIADSVSSSPFFKADVPLGFAAVALIVVTLGAAIWSGQRLRSLSITGDD